MSLLLTDENNPQIFIVDDFGDDDDDDGDGGDDNDGDGGDNNDSTLRTPERIEDLPEPLWEQLFDEPDAKFDHDLHKQGRRGVCPLSASVFEHLEKSKPIFDMMHSAAYGNYMKRSACILGQLVDRREQKLTDTILNNLLIPPQYKTDFDLRFKMPFIPYVKNRNAETLRDEIIPSIYETRMCQEGLFPDSESVYIFHEIIDIIHQIADNE
jgi:hypothetical protein